MPKPLPVNLDRDVVALQHAAVLELNALPDAGRVALHERLQPVKRGVGIHKNVFRRNREVAGIRADDLFGQGGDVEEAAERFVDQPDLPVLILHQHALVQTR